MRHTWILLCLLTAAPAAGQSALVLTANGGAEVTAGPGDCANIVRIAYTVTATVNCPESKNLVVHR